MSHFFFAIFLAIEIIGGTLVGLIVLAAAMATIRSAVGDKSPAWGVSSVAAAEAKAAEEGWLHRSLVAFDIAVNVIVLRGQADETISAHSWRASVEGKLWGKLMTKWLDWIQPFHGQKAASGDLERAKVRVKILSRMLND